MGALTAAIGAGKWALANWRLVLGIVAIGGLAAFAGVQYVEKINADNGRLAAEKELGDYKLDQANENNATWRELNEKREAFEQEVREGFDKLSESVGKLEAAKAAFQSTVKSNANSNRPLDPVERAALGLLGNVHADQAGGGAVQSPGAVPPVRGRQDRH